MNRRRYLRTLPGQVAAAVLAVGGGAAGGVGVEVVGLGKHKLELHACIHCKHKQ